MTNVTNEYNLDDLTLPKQLHHIVDERFVRDYNLATKACQTLFSFFSENKVGVEAGCAALSGAMVAAASQIAVKYSKDKVTLEEVASAYTKKSVEVIGARVDKRSQPVKAAQPEIKTDAQMAMVTSATPNDAGSGVAENEDGSIDEARQKIADIIAKALVSEMRPGGMLR